MGTLMEKIKQVHDEELFNVSTLTEEGVVIATAAGYPALISFDTLKEAMDIIKKKETDPGTTYKFSGIINSNTSIQLEHLTNEEVAGITKFLEALKDAESSYVDVHELIIDRH